MYKIFLFITCLLSISLTNAELIEWTIHSHKKQNSLLNNNFIKYVVNPVNKEFPNEFKMTFIPQGHKSSLHNNYSLFSAVRFGNIEGRFSATMYWGNINPAFAIFGDLIGAWSSTSDFIKWYEEENAVALFQKLYTQYNMKFIGFTLSPHESLVSMKPIRNISDIKGKVIRTPPGSMSQSFFDELGAVVRPFSMKKVKDAFEKGQIEIADFSTISANLDEGVHETAKHTNYPGFHSLPILEFVVNKSKWDKLPLKVKKSILKHSKIWRDKNIQVINQHDKISLKKLQAQNVKTYRWSEDEIKKARIVAAKVWAKYAKKSQTAKELIDSITKWLKERNKL